MSLKPGDRVSWQYTHRLNARSSVERVKNGVYFGKINHTAKHFYNSLSEQLGYVLFDGNKTYSKVPVGDLKKIKN